MKLTLQNLVVIMEESYFGLGITNYFHCLLNKKVKIKILFKTFKMCFKPGSLDFPRKPCLTGG